MLQKKDQYVFRGQADARYLLQPAAFRQEEIRRFSFPFFPVEDQVIKTKWFRGPVNKIV